MSAPDYPLTTEPVVAWRSWRVLPFTRLDGSKTVRLCAVGTLGTPKVWEPRQVTTASCSRYTSEHEAPWRSCECGVWALKSPETTRQRMVSLMLIQDGEPLSWAMGKVSLWGRVIEHEDGWRAQFAYPFSLTVESLDESVARELRRVYAIDVEWAGGELLARVCDKRAIFTLEQAVAGPKSERRTREEEEEKRELLAKPPLDLSDLTIDEVLTAHVTVVAGFTSQYPRARAIHWHVDTSDILECVLYARGEAPPFRIFGGERSGLESARRAVRNMLKKAREEGYVEYGLPFEARSRSGKGYWFLTRSGLKRVAKSAPATAPYFGWGAGKYEREEVDLPRAVRLLRRHPRPLFVEEVKALIPGWMEERRAAQKQGRRAYRAWLRERRENGRPGMLWFEDSEVEAAVHRLCRRQETVTAVQAMDELASADKPGDRLKGEMERMSYQLTRLHRQGRLSRSKRKGAPPQWSPANSNPVA